MDTYICVIIMIYLMFPTTAHNVYACSHFNLGVLIHVISSACAINCRDLNLRIGNQSTFSLERHLHCNSSWHDKVLGVNLFTPAIIFWAFPTPVCRTWQITIPISHQSPVMSALQCCSFNVLVECCFSWWLTRNLSTFANEKKFSCFIETLGDAGSV